MSLEISSNQAKGNLSLHLQKSIVDTERNLFWKHLASLLISSHVVIGLAKIFNLEILRHGTSIGNHISILKTGADPARGGSEKGSTHQFTGGTEVGMLSRTRGYFFVFKDSEARQLKYKKIESKSLKAPGVWEDTSYYRDENGKMLTPAQYDSLSHEERYRPMNLSEKIEYYFAPKFHAAMSAYSSIPNNQNTISKIKKFIHAFLNFVFSPTLRFIYSREETKTLFIDDPDYSGKAYKTPYALSNRRIGLLGVCSQAEFGSFKKGLKERPSRVLGGVVELVAGLALTAVGAGLIT